MLKAVSGVLTLPSLTLMTMFEYVPASVVAGVPDSRPVDVLKAAHAGFAEMANVSASPFASAAVGLKEYAAPAVTDVLGATGDRRRGVRWRRCRGVTVVPFTVTANGASFATVLPSVIRNDDIRIGAIDVSRVRDAVDVALVAAEIRPARLAADRESGARSSDWTRSA